MSEAEQIVYLTTLFQAIGKILVFLGVALLIITITSAINLHFILKRDVMKKMNSEEKRKFKIICSLEGNSIPDEVYMITTMYMDTYTKKHKINWDEYL